MMCSILLRFKKTNKVLFKETVRKFSKTSSVRNNDALSGKYTNLGVKNTYFNLSDKKFCSKMLSLHDSNNITNSHHRYLHTIPELVPFSKEHTIEFMSYFPMIVKCLTDDPQLMADVNEAKKRFVACLNYNVPTGKRVRGLTTVISYKFLEKPENLTPENVMLVNILGWFVEMIEASSIMYDDIVDNSVTRRNSICWHRKEGLTAITDALALNVSAYLILNKYFSSHPFYAQMADLTHRVIYYGSFGQHMDSRKYHHTEISMDKCKVIAKYKSSLFTFYYPTILGMYLSKKYTEEMHNQVAPILYDLGVFFQINNDVHDSFADESITGKRGSDIEESKCTWLSARALEKCSTSQRKFFGEHFGKPEKEAVNNIKNLYLELDILNDYYEFEKKFFISVQDRAGSLKTPERELVIVIIKKFQDQLAILGKNLISGSKFK